MSDGVALRLKGAAVSARSVHDALDATLTILDGAARSVDEDSKPDWRVTEAVIGSVHLSMAAPGGRLSFRWCSTDRKRFALQRESQLDATSRWSVPSALPHVQVGGHRDGGREVTVVVDRQVAENADRALLGQEVSLGSVLGRVDSWTDRKQTRVGMTRDIDGLILPVTFREQLNDRVVREALGRRIEARGELRRNSVGQLVRLHMEDFLRPRGGQPRVRLNDRQLWSDESLDPMTVDE